MNNPVGIPCNACENNHCPNCVAESMEAKKWIQSAADHCSCARNGHDPDAKPMVERKVKSMLGTKKDEDGHAAEPELVDEVERD